MNKLCNKIMDRISKTKGEPELPKTGRVNEVCKEWGIREDGALAYRLQSQEINQHLSGNKNRNAQVREDFPCALDEQIREQELAEQAAAVYQKMLSEQEEIDTQIAKQLADRIEREERMKRRALEMQDEGLARQILEKEKLKKQHQSPHRPDSNNYFANLPRRQAPQMPLPNNVENYSYMEPYKSEIIDDFDRIDIQEVGLPIDDFTERQMQEERDAELARKLQDQESNSEEATMNRDRMLAMEAQDKELAKLLQERERAKAKRAKERAKQRSLAKKQLLELEQHNQILPDDSYSNPIDLLPQRTVIHHIQPMKNTQGYHQHEIVDEDDTNYSFPVDLLPNRSGYDPKHASPHKSYDLRYTPEKMNGGANTFPSYINDSPLDDVPPPVRPTQLDLRSPITQKMSKPRFPDPIDPPDEILQISTSTQQLPSPSKQHMNIAMAIDPTYPRRNHHHHSPPSYDTTSSTVTTSTASSSPGMLLPTPDLPEDDPSPVPPYMPIQGQRRTASLEKKHKKRGKDGCKQQ